MIVIAYFQATFVRSCVSYSGPRTFTPDTRSTVYIYIHTTHVQGLDDNYVLLDPIKVGIVSPGMGDDGNLDESGIPGPLVNAYLESYGTVAARTTDFQVLVMFSIGVTKGVYVLSVWSCWLAGFCSHVPCRTFMWFCWLFG